MSMLWLVALVRLAGDKLPQIWPHVMHIVGDVSQIITILGFSQNMQAVSTKELNDAGSFKGVPEDEAKTVVSTFKALDESL